MAGAAAGLRPTIKFSSFENLPRARRCGCAGSRKAMARWCWPATRTGASGARRRASRCRRQSSRSCSAKRPRPGEVVTWATPVSGTGITGGGSGYAALLAHGRSSVRHGTRLGDLKNKQPTHTGKDPRRVPKATVAYTKNSLFCLSQPKSKRFTPPFGVAAFRLATTYLPRFGALHAKCPSP